MERSLPALEARVAALEAQRDAIVVQVGSCRTAGRVRKQQGSGGANPQTLMLVGCERLTYSGCCLR